MMVMLNWIQYIVESGVCFFALTVFYYIFLRKETFFQLNRIYLLITPVLALVIPALRIEIYESNVPVSLSLLYEILINAKTVNYYLFKQVVFTTSTSFTFSITNFAFILYPIGVMVMGSKLVLKLLQLLNIIRKSDRVKHQQYTLVLTKKPLPTASFFHFLFWGEEKNEKDNAYVLKHELMHIRQHHSLDNLTMELYLVLMWFNPLLYWYKKELRLTHEFIADSGVIGQTNSLYYYAKLLVRRSQAKPAFDLFSTFSHGKVKARIMMLTKRVTNRRSILKYLLFLPLLLGLILLFSCNMIDPYSINAFK